MKKLNIVGCLLLLLFQTRCAVVNKTAKAPLSSFELTDLGAQLIDKRWVETAVQVIDSSQTKNISNQFLRTDKDDLMIFSKDGTYQFDEGKSKARQKSRQIYENGSWHLEGNDLILFSQGSQTQYLILDVSESFLVLKLPVKKERYYYLLTYQNL